MPSYASTLVGRAVVSWTGPRASCGALRKTSAGFHVSCYKTIGLLLVLALVSDGAHAQNLRVPELPGQARTLAADPEHGRILYLKRCTGCHGRRAWGDGPKQIPALAGQREFYLLQQLARFAARERNSSLMQESIHPADVDRPQAFRDLAAYLGRASRNPQSDHGDGRALLTGERTYRRECSACHGQSGQGNDPGAVPAIGGQQYYYVVHRLQGFADLHRAAVASEVLSLAAGLSAEEQEGLADYISRLTSLITADAQ